MRDHDYISTSEGQALAKHGLMFGAQDKFVDYIHHVENAKQSKRERASEEVQIMINT